MSWSSPLFIRYEKYQFFNVNKRNFDIQYFLPVARPQIHTMSKDIPCTFELLRKYLATVLQLICNSNNDSEGI